MKCQVCRRRNGTAAHFIGPLCHPCHFDLVRLLRLLLEGVADLRRVDRQKVVPVVKAMLALGGRGPDLVQTTDPGRALVSGLWKDVGRFKGPILHGLAARPYFHNGLAAQLEDVVNFYDGRFNIGFTAQQKLDLVAFLRTL